jgi:hypothetical protein
MSGGVVVADSIWTVTGKLDDGSVRTTVVASATMRKAVIGWTVTLRCGPVAVKTWHATCDGASARQDFGQHHLTETVARIEGRMFNRPAGQAPAIADEVQWGVRTTHTDGSQGTDWSSEGEARSFLAHYADYDGEQHMHIRTRELVRRPIAAGNLEVAESDYATRRAAADERAKGRRR